MSGIAVLKPHPGSVNHPHQARHELVARSDPAKRAVDASDHPSRRHIGPVPLVEPSTPRAAYCGPADGGLAAVAARVPHSHQCPSIAERPHFAQVAPDFVPTATPPDRVETRTRWQDPQPLSRVVFRQSFQLSGHAVIGPALPVHRQPYLQASDLLGDRRRHVEL